MVKCLPTMQETWVQSVSQKDPLEKKMANHSSILAWKIPWTEEHGSLQSMGSQRVWHHWVTSLHFTSLLRFMKDFAFLSKQAFILLRWLLLSNFWYQMKCHYFREPSSVTLFNGSCILTIFLYVNVFIFLVTMTKSKYISYNYPLTFITFHAGLDWTSLQEGIFFFNFLFIFDCAGSSLPHEFFSISDKQGLLSSPFIWASHCGDFFCCRAWILELVGLNRFGSQALEHRLNSCGTRALLLCGICDFRRSGTHVSCIGRWILHHWDTKEAQKGFLFILPMDSFFNKYLLDGYKTQEPIFFK